MLVLSRKPGERIRIGDDVRLTVVRIGPNAVRIGIDAPVAMRIVREELLDVTSDDPLPTPCTGGRMPVAIVGPGREPVHAAADTPGRRHVQRQREEA